MRLGLFQLFGSDPNGFRDISDPFSQLFQQIFDRGDVVVDRGEDSARHGSDSGRITADMAVSNSTPQQERRRAMKQRPVDPGGVSTQNAARLHRPYVKTLSAGQTGEVRPVRPSVRVTVVAPGG
jgi:hypothetical protein